MRRASSRAAASSSAWAREVGEAELRQAALARAEQLARRRAAAGPPRRCGSRRRSRAGCSSRALRGLAERRPGRAGGRSSAAVPRPTRPRSWCSWARPKRSACSITITVAAGTSTPTSITVVATRSCELARGESGHRPVLLRRLHAGRAPARRDRRSAACELRRRCSGRRQVDRPRIPRPAGRPNRRARRCRRARSTRCDDLIEPLERQRARVDGLAARPASPAGARHRDRHRPSASGCAGSASRSSPGRRRPGPWPPASGADARRSDAARRSPRAPRSANATSSWNSAWVPTASAISPARQARRAAPSRAAALVAPGQQRELHARCRAPAARCVAQMLARQDLGRRHAAPPGRRPRPRSAWRAAPPRVLPLPTSPCSRRSMRVSARHVGVDLGQRAASAPAVRRKGRAASRLAAQPAVAGDAAARAGRRWRARTRRERQLVGQQLVDRPGAGAPAYRAPGRASLLRLVHGCERGAPGRPTLPLEIGRVLPFRQFGCAGERPRGSPCPAAFGVDARGQGIDRLDLLERSRAPRAARCSRDGPSAGRRAAVALDPAADRPRRADGQRRSR